MSVSFRLFGAAPFAAIALMAATSTTVAAPAAVDLVFYAPHFAKIENGSTVSYRFIRKNEDPKGAPSFEDEINVKVGPKGAEDSLQVDLFTGARAATLPNMSKTGNPVIVAVMEQDVKDMQKALGGSPFYFRNRLREALSAQQPAEPTKIEFGGKTVDAWKVSFKPFENDEQNKGKLREYAGRSYELTFSDAVPGGLYALKAVTPKADGGELVSEELVVKADVSKVSAEPAGGAAK